MQDVTNTKVLALLTIWGVAAGVIYLASYWGSFGLNPFEYIDGRGVFQAGLFSLVVSISFLVLGALLGHLVFGPIFPPGGGAKTPIGVRLVPVWKWIGIINLVAIVLITIFNQRDEKWLVIACLGAMYSVVFRDSPFLVAISQRAEVRAIISFMLIFIPLLAIGAGFQDASAARYGKSKRIVDMAASVVPASQQLSGEIAYLGKLGETYVLFDLSSQRVVLLDVSGTPQLVFKGRAKAPNSALQRTEDR